MPANTAEKPDSLSDSKLESPPLAKSADGTSESRLPSEPVIPATPRRSNLKWVILIIAIAVAGGYFAGSMITGRKPRERLEEKPAAKESQTSNAEHAPHAKDPAPKESAKPRRTEIEVLIREERYSEALRELETPSEPNHDHKAVVHRYRAALCWEGLREWQKAADIYAALAEEESMSAQKIAFQIGQSRCWMHLQRTSDLRAMLARFVLMSGHPAMRERAYIGEVFFLQAELEATEFPLPAPPSPFRADGLASVPMTQAIERYLDWIGPPAAHVEKSHDQDDLEKDVDLTRNSRNEELHLVSAALKPRPVPELLMRLCKAANWKLHMSADSESLLSGRTTPLYVSRLPIGDVISAICESTGVRWSLSDGRLELQATTESIGNFEQQSLRARNALRRAVTAAPDHPSVIFARLTLGNLEFQSKRYGDAAPLFHKILLDKPHDPRALAAAYNLGLTQMQLNDRRAARDSFLEVIDRAPSDRWTALAWSWTARTHLDEGSVSGAVYPYKQALKFAGESDVRPAATLGLSTALLLSGKPLDAHTVMKPLQRTWRQESYRGIAAFLDAYCRFSAAQNNRTTQLKERDDLVMAILAYGVDSPTGPAGTLLFGQACREASFAPLLLEHYDRAMESLQGPLALRMNWEAGEQLLSMGRLDAAMQRFLAVAAVDEGEWGARSRLQLAEIELRNGQPRKSLKLCREVVGSYPSLRDAALVVMGKSFAKLGDHERAAICFGGKMPE